MRNKSFNLPATLIALCALLPVGHGLAQSDTSGIKFFESKIRPALIEHCYKCHSQESKKVKGGLLLDSHEGTAGSLIGLKAHYNFRELDSNNLSLDPRMAPEGAPQFLDITRQEQQELFAFLRTLTGTDVYSNAKWSDPFDHNGELILIHEK